MPDKSWFEQAKNTIPKNTDPVLPQYGYSSTQVTPSTSPINLKEYTGYTGDVQLSGNTGEDLARLDELRAQNQSAAEQAWHSFEKFNIYAGTTFVDGVAGTIFGLGNVIAHLGDGKPVSEHFSDFWNNPISNAMTDIQEWSEKAMPNYRTAAEIDAPFWKSALGIEDGFVNFWGDTVFKNLGFTVGAIGAAYLTGGMSAEALGIKTLAKNAYGKIAKKLFLSEAEVAAQIADGTLDFAKLTGELAKDARKLKNLNTMQTYGSSLMGAMSEARFEAINGAKEYYDSRKDYYIKGGMSKAEADAKASKESLGVGNTIFSLNSALLTISNAMEFKSILSPGYNLESKAIKGLTKQGEKYAFEGVGKLEKTLKALKNPFTEGLEEMSQTAIEYGTQSYYQRVQNPDNTNILNNIIGAAGDGMRHAFSEEGLEGFFTGFFTGAVGMPNIRKAVQDNSVKSAISGWSGGIREQLVTIREEEKRGTDNVEKLNKILEDESFQKNYMNVAASLGAEKAKQVALRDKDEVGYEVAHNQQFHAVVQQFIDSGKLDDLYEILDNQASKSGDILRQEWATKGDTGFVDNFNTLTNEELEDANKKRVEAQKKLTKRIAEFTDMVETKVANNISPEIKKTLTEALTLAEFSEQRLKENKAIIQDAIYNYLENNPEKLETPEYEGFNPKFGSLKDASKLPTDLKEHLNKMFPSEIQNYIKYQKIREDAQNLYEKISSSPEKFEQKIEKEIEKQVKEGAEKINSTENAKPQIFKSNSEITDRAKVLGYNKDEDIQYIEYDENGKQIGSGLIKTIDGEKMVVSGKETPKKLSDLVNKNIKIVLKQDKVSQDIQAAKKRRIDILKRMEEQSKKHYDSTEKDIRKAQEEIENLKKQKEQITEKFFTEKQSIEEAEEAAKIEANKQSILSNVGSRFSYKNKIGFLLQEENGQYVFETDNTVYELDDEDILKLKIIEEENPEVKLYNVNYVSEEIVNVNGINYFIRTGPNGNVIGLSPTNTPIQVLKNEKLLLAVEIERNKHNFEKKKSSSKNKVKKETKNVSSESKVKVDKKKVKSITKSKVKSLIEITEQRLANIDSTIVSLEKKIASLNERRELLSEYVQTIETEIAKSLDDSYDTIDHINSIEKKLRENTNLFDDYAYDKNEGDVEYINELKKSLNNSLINIGKEVTLMISQMDEMLSEKLELENLLKDYKDTLSKLDSREEILKAFETKFSETKIPENFKFMTVEYLLGFTHIADLKLYLGNDVLAENLREFKKEFSKLKEDATKYQIEIDRFSELVNKHRKLLSDKIKEESYLESFLKYQDLALVRKEFEATLFNTESELSLNTASKEKANVYAQEEFADELPTDYKKNDVGSVTYLHIEYDKGFQDRLETFQFNGKTYTRPMYRLNEYQKNFGDWMSELKDASNYSLKLVTTNTATEEELNAINRFNPEGKGEDSVYVFVVDSNKNLVKFNDKLLVSSILDNVYSAEGKRFGILELKDFLNKNGIQVDDIATKDVNDSQKYWFEIGGQRKEFTFEVYGSKEGAKEAFEKEFYEAMGNEYRSVKKSLYEAVNGSPEYRSITNVSNGFNVRVKEKDAYFKASEVFRPEDLKGAKLRISLGTNNTQRGTNDARFKSSLPVLTIAGNRDVAMKVRNLNDSEVDFVFNLIKFHGKDSRKGIMVDKVPLFPPAIVKGTNRPAFSVMTNYLNLGSIKVEEKDGDKVVKKIDKEKEQIFITEGGRLVIISKLDLNTGERMETFKVNEWDVTKLDDVAEKQIKTFLKTKRRNIISDYLAKPDSIGREYQIDDKGNVTEKPIKKSYQQHLIDEVVKTDVIPYTEGAQFAQRYFSFDFQENKNGDEWDNLETEIVPFEEDTQSVSNDSGLEAKSEESTVTDLSELAIPLENQATNADFGFEEDLEDDALSTLRDNLAQRDKFAERKSKAKEDFGDLRISNPGKTLQSLIDNNVIEKECL